MTNYDQHMRHFRNHRKDRFYQQCGVHTREPGEIPTPEQIERMERRSFLSIIEKTKDEEFPIFIRQGSGGIWFTTSERDCFGNRIENRDQLLEFYSAYVAQQENENELY